MAEIGEQVVDNESLAQRSVLRSRQLFDRDADLRVSGASPEALQRLERARSSLELIETACHLYEGRPAVAHRLGDGPDFLTVTFSELWRGIVRLATGLHREKMVREGDFVAVVAFGGPGFVTAEIAAVYLGATAVPLQTNLPPKVLSAVLRETGVRCVVCDDEQVPLVASILGDCPDVRSVVTLAPRREDSSRQRHSSLAHRGPMAPDVRFVALDEIQALGDGPAAPVATVTRGANPLRTVVYTSGSTGSPKGAMFPESVYVQKWLPGRARTYPFPPSFQVPIPVSFVFSPLGHQMGNELVAASLMRGGLTYLAVHGDTSRLFEDFRAARPTFIGFVPRVANQIYEDWLQQAGRRSGWSKDPREVARAKEQVMEEMRETTLGDRLLVATSASAPIGIEVLAFLRSCFRAPVYNLVGMTEVGGFLFDGRVRRDNVVDYRLVDVPEKGFSVRDVPHPRGELLLRTRRQIPGYFRADDATRATFTEDGYVRTGDVFEQRGPDDLVWIARKSRVLKLAHGKFVNLSQLESTFVQTGAFIQQVYVHGSSERAYPVAVIVPNLAAIRAHLKVDGVPSEDQIRAVLAADLRRTAREANLQPFEVPRAFIVEIEPFSVANGLVADNGKLSPAKLQAKFKARLEDLYEQLERTRRDDGRELRELGPDAGVEQRFRKALEAVLGAAAADAPRSATFVELGGDSLNAVALSAVLAKECGLRVPVAMVLRRDATIADLVSHIEGTGRDSRASGNRVHADPAWLRADEVSLDRFLPPEELGAPATREVAAPARSKTVLLTGASGFLGRFLLLELLARAPEEIAAVVCIVRARDDASARARIAAGLATDPALEQRFAQLDRAGRVRVFAGDLMQAEFGLSRAVYDQLASEVDTVVHAAALVNHALAYDALFEPNVLGTVEVIRFCLRGSFKRMNFVSTVGLAEGLDRGTPVREGEDAHSLWTRRARSGGGPGHGYTSTKWAGELLLLDLHRRFGVPVNVFRSGSIMAHPTFRGQINVDDFLCRLWCGLAFTGIAPNSFYVGADGTASFDGLPVDFVARAITDVAVQGKQTARDHAIYHVVGSARAGGASLDVLTSWAQEYGLPFSRVADYDEWYRLFTERLVALEGPRRQQSPLAIVERWRTPRRTGARLDGSRFHERLRDSERRSELDVPKLTKEFVFKCLDDLHHLALL
jgi:fatty acid CoA ligase FadD9